MTTRITIQASDQHAVRVRFNNHPTGGVTMLDESIIIAAGGTHMVTATQTCDIAIHEINPTEAQPDKIAVAAMASHAGKNPVTGGPGHHERVVGPGDGIVGEKPQDEVEHVDDEEDEE
jgi:hypothetical protein